MTKRYLKYILYSAAMVSGLTVFSCKEKELKPVNVEITDPIRHYYPVTQGAQMPVSYEIENLSDDPLMIQEIQTSCGCVIPNDELPIVILPKKSGKINLTFNSIKNTGATDIYVWLYGNFADSTYRELKFTTNVVPPADYTRDYEQLYQEFVTNTGTIKDIVDGYSFERGYYTDEGNPRAEEQKRLQEKADSYAF